jgi:multimeric flavodoxin WrbA
LIVDTLLVLDKDAQTGISRDLKARILSVLSEMDCRVDTFELGRNEPSPCRGCLLCLTQNAGQCVSRDIISKIKSGKKYSLAVLISPVLFGHFSSTIKNCVDRGLGSSHLEIIIGCGSDIDEEEKNTFIDLTARHRGSADVVHPGLNRQVDVYVTRSVEENSLICKALKDTIRAVAP